MPSFIASDIKVLIADDHSMVRTGLQMMLHLELGIKNVVDATTCAEVMSTLRSEKPTHLIIDIVFKDGNSLEILPTITNLYPELPVMVYSMMPTEVYISVLAKYGVRHYLNKSATPAYTATALRNYFFDNAPTTQPLASEASEVNVFERLTQRELEVLHYLLKGESNYNIAQAMNIHKNTVSTLKTRILEKTELRNMKELFETAAMFNMFS